MHIILCRVKVSIVSVFLWTAFFDFLMENYLIMIECMILLYLYMGMHYCKSRNMYMTHL